MRKIFICVLFLSSIGSSYCQQVSVVPKVSTIDYGTKAKKQKTGAWLLLGGGAVLFTGSIIHGLNHMFEYNQKLPTTFIIGSTLMTASLPLFIISSKNNKKAKSISTSLINESIPNSRGLNHAEVSYSALFIKLNF